VNDLIVVRQRPAKNPLNPYQPYATRWEQEPDASGSLVPTAVVFLTNRECPFKCVMCDLWINTLDATVPAGAIPQQIRDGLSVLPPARQIKLYNAGNYFDPGAIPPEDDAAIAREVSAFERVVVESHPAFLAGPYAERCLRFRDSIAGRLEVAIGLETANPAALKKLNKNMTLESFRRSADFLGRHGIALRAFILLNPPFLAPADAVEWACRSLGLASQCGATASAVIPTRAGPGLRVLDPGFRPPRLNALEAVVEHGLHTWGGGMRVFGDLWDIERFFDCECSTARAERLGVMNREQRVPPAVTCGCETRH
jgi:hypothetical protein